jgi:hypothetical protein
VSSGLHWGLFGLSGDDEKKQRKFKENMLQREFENAVIVE